MERFDKRLVSWRNFFYPRWIGLCKHVFWGKGENDRITLAMSVLFSFHAYFMLTLMILVLAWKRL